MRSIFLFVVLFFIVLSSCDMHAQPVHQNFYDSFEKFKEPAISNRRFKHEDIIPLMKKLEGNPVFEVKKVGKSVENRDLYMVKAGKGDTKVLLWSQMHGDEPTATMALMDIFNFLGQSNEYDDLKKEILENTTLYFIPMLNPDGAAVYKRRNALDVDLNRDAVRLQSPEARLLKHMRDSLNADFGFNLHDQSIHYSAGDSPAPATMSFLAPPYDYGKSVNKVRGDAMKLVVSLNNMLQNYIPGQVAKYSDDFEPRAFGDNIQKWGTSVVLFEAGGYHNDPEKQEIRKLNYTAILAGLYAIAQKTYQNEKLDDYYKIPENKRILFDLVIRGVEMEKDKQMYKLDIGVHRAEINYNNYRDFFYKSAITELGHMSVFYGYDELDAEGYQLIPGKVFPKVFKSMKEAEQTGIKKLLSEGYTTIKLKNVPAGMKFTSLPVNVVSTQKAIDNTVAIGKVPNFVLFKDGKAYYAIVNGFVYDLQNDINKVKNGLVE
jgi:hypothetical protein